jgi:hypothetical protein
MSTWKKVLLGLFVALVVGTILFLSSDKSFWIQIILGLVIALVIGTIICFVVLGSNKRRDISTPTTTSPSTRKWVLWVILAIIVLAIVAFTKSLWWPRLAAHTWWAVAGAILLLVLLGWIFRRRSPSPACHGGGGTPLINNHPNTTWAGWVNAIFALAFFSFLAFVLLIFFAQARHFLKDRGNNSQQLVLVEESRTFDVTIKPIRVCLTGHWVATTLSGNIDITAPNGIKFVGGKSGENYPAGWYIFEPNKENPAPSVSITTIWHSPQRVRECN